MDFGDTMRRYLCFAFLLWLTLFVFQCAVPAATAEDPDRVLLVYMLGGDLETQSGAAAADLSEMAGASKDDPFLTVFVQIGGCARYRHPALTDGSNYRLRIREGRVDVIEILPADQSMTDADTLCEFIRACGCADASMIFWGHGCPGFDGIGYDEANRGGCLSLYGIRDALERTGVRFRTIGFDACSMATLEAAWTVSPYCEWFAASPLDESLSGWNYNRALPSLFHPIPLQEERSRGRNGLTVLSMETFLRETDNMIRVLGTCGTSRGLGSLGDAAEACGDHDAGEQIASFLDGQVLLFGAADLQGIEPVIGGPGFLEAYLSFLGRK